MPTTTRRSPNIPRAAEFPPARPLTANQQRRRARILDATRCLVIKHGYDGMIMRDVAATAEVSATTLYNLYNTKDELLLEALRERVTNTTARAVRKSGGPGCAYLLAHVSSVCQETRKSPANYSGQGKTGWDEGREPAPTILTNQYDRGREWTRRHEHRRF